MKGGKFLVLRRDGTVPEWPYFVLGAKDPAASSALLAYADAAEKMKMDPEYVQDIKDLAREFAEIRHRRGPSQPDETKSTAERKDHPVVMDLLTGKKKRL